MIKEYITGIAVKLNLMIYRYFDILWDFFFTYVKKLLFVYYYGADEKVKNITFNYWTTIGLDKYRSGIYYLIINHKMGIERVAINGIVNDVEDTTDKILVKDTNIDPKRKNVLLLNGDEPVALDLNIIDNYMANSLVVGNSAITDLSIISKLIGVKCTNVAITGKFPNIIRNILSIDKLTIDKLYD